MSRLIFLLAFAPLALAAQAPRGDSVFARAERLVREGDGERGRELVDSVLTAAPAGSPVLAEALYWRAALAASTADAERDFRRLVVEFATHPRAESAMLRLAQLEFARGDRERALAHLQRFEREHPSSPQRAWASLLLGRLYLDQNELPRACIALGAARAAAPAEAVELRNQVEFYTPRCAGVDTTRVASSGSRDSARAPVDSKSGGAPRPRAEPAAAAASRGRFTVQVAAFNTQAEAQSLVDALAQRKLDARVVGEARPFRVRVGRFETRAAAAAMLRTIKAKRIDGFVTEAER
ncbi:MAG TPA: SPOR domain-containing protein [Gemmatimonadaceae bacterium]|nr:SPOR domain-containing protein [Gemmatimonadaceae bacterium]